MNIRSSQKTTTYLFAAIFVLGTLAAVGMQFTPFKSDKNVERNKSNVKTDTVANKLPVYDEALLKTFRNVLSQFSAAKKTYTIAGTITLINKADTAENMNNVEFVICKNGDDFYYKQGAAESLNKDSLFLDINPTSKKVFLSAKRELSSVAIIDSAKLTQALQNENYTLKSDTTDRYQTISLINEDHPSCKQYTVTFDILSKRAVRMQMRLAAPEDPSDKKKERTVNIRISKFVDSADIDMYKKVSQIINKNGELTGNYINYKLITIN